MMIEDDNWNYRKAMLKFIGLDIGESPAPVGEPVPAAKMEDFLSRLAALGILKPAR